MAKALVLGGGGMVGQKLAHRLCRHSLAGVSPVDVTLFDLGFPETSPAMAKKVVGTIGDVEALRLLVKDKPDFIFHLASIVSGEAEQDFEKGWSTNMLAMWNLLEVLRQAHETWGGAYKPKVIFTSSIAVFGGPYPDQISDTFLSAPQTSYGAQKSICETLLSDFSRKGFLDGISLRLPTICVRPGKANMAASSFFSGIIREPLNGQTARLPVADTVRHWHASPRAAAQFLIHAALLDTAQLNGRNALNLPGVSCTVAEQIEALRALAGQAVVDLIVPDPDPVVAKIVEGWPRDFQPERAIDLGFRAENNFKEIIETYIADDFKSP